MTNTKHSRLKRLELKLRVDQRSVEKSNREWFDQRMISVKMWARLADYDPELKKARKTYGNVMEEANAEGRTIPRGPSKEWKEWINKQHARRQDGGPSIPEPWGNDSDG